tara:strand:+ start:219 stop:491 length:273 start_codon:yes stop_codon:yes gene_type:complete
MTIDRSLRIRRGSMGNRNVLTRIERLKKLAEMDRWEEGDSVFGLAKVRVEKVSMKRKKKSKVEEGEEELLTAEGAEGAEVADDASNASEE